MDEALSANRVQEVETWRSRDIDIPAIRRETLSANREMIKSSEFRQALGAVDAELDKLPPTPLQMGYIARATTEKEMRRAILKEGASPLDRGRYEVIETWASSASAPVKWLIAMMTLGVIISPGLIDPILGVLSFIISMFPVMFFIADMSVNRTGNVAARFQNQVLKRRAYKKEVRRLMRVAEEKRTQRERFLNIREAKLAALQEALTPLAEDYATANPGKTLAILSGENKLYVDVTDDKTYTKLDRIAASAILGDTDS